MIKNMIILRLAVHDMKRRGTVQKTHYCKFKSVAGAGIKKKLQRTGAIDPGRKVRDRAASFFLAACYHCRSAWTFLSCRKVSAPERARIRRRGCPGIHRVHADQILPDLVDRSPQGHADGSD